MAWSTLSCCEDSRARTRSYSASGLIKTFSNLNRFIADIGGQLRMITLSCCRSTIIWQIALNWKQNKSEADHGPLCSSWTKYFLLRSIDWTPGQVWSFIYDEDEPFQSTCELYAAKRSPWLSFLQIQVTGKVRPYRRGIAKKSSSQWSVVCCFTFFAFNSKKSSKNSAPTTCYCYCPISAMNDSNCSKPSRKKLGM